MKSTAEHPFLFFDHYLENRIYKDLETFYKEVIEEEEVHSIDKEKQSATILTPENDNNYTILSFEQTIKSKVKREINITKRLIESGFQKRFSNNTEVKAYAYFLKIKLDQYSNNTIVQEFSFLNNYFNEITVLINQYSKQKATINSNYFSFNLISNTPEEQLSKIDTLHSLLTKKPPIIKCSKKEFTAAFTGKQLEEGIYWLITGKNKLISKTSLIYFIDEMIKKKYLNPSIITDLNKYIKYVFRDNLGNELKNLKQSKSTYSKNVTLQKSIDTIISSL